MILGIIVITVGVALLLGRLSQQVKNSFGTPVVTAPVAPGPAYPTFTPAAPAPSQPAPAAPSQPVPTQVQPAPFASAPAPAPFTPSPAPAASLPQPGNTAAVPQAGQPWQNDLGMKFIPVPGLNSVLFSIWDTRVEDFRAFAEATGFGAPGGINVLQLTQTDNGETLGLSPDPNASWAQPGFVQGPTYPVVGVSWLDAKAFCRWLTAREQQEGRLGPNQCYRLPTNSEWSFAVGDRTYPWGDSWPPPANAGNYGDQTFATSIPNTRIHGALETRDGFARTSPVGNFPPNAYGLYDMGSNVAEWCEDWFRRDMNSQDLRDRNPPLNDDQGGQALRVLRGASWNISAPDMMLSEAVDGNNPDDRTATQGFRCVLDLNAGAGAAPAPTSTPGAYQFRQ